MKPPANASRRNPIEGNRNNRPDDTRFVFDRRLDDDPAPPLPTKQLVDRDGSMRRETTGQATSRDDGATGRRNRTWRGSLKDTLPQRAHGVARHSVERCNGNAGERITPPGVYVVKRGDSPWKIGRRHYNRGSLHPIIHRLNKRKIRRARLIYPCQRFRLPKQRFR